LRRDGLECDRHNLLNPGGEQRKPYITEAMENEGGVVVASLDYMKCLPDNLRQWIPQTLVGLGCDGYGMSESREALRDHFEVDERFIALATLRALADAGEIEMSVVQNAITELKIDPNKPDPMAP